MNLNSFVFMARSAAIQVYTDGDAAVKVGASGFALLLTALSEAASTVIFSVLCLFWLADMASGLLRAMAVSRGRGGFSWGRFFGGFIKFGAAAVGIGVAVGIDQIAVDVLSLDRQYATTAAMSGIALAFAASATENLAYWFPGVAGQLARILNRGQTTPDYADPRLRLKDLPEPTQERIRTMLAEERPLS